LFVLLTLFAQRAVVFSFSKVAPKLSKISPISGAKNKFGPKGLFEFAKSAAKLGLVSALLMWFAMGKLDEMLVALMTSPAQIMVQLSSLLIEFLTIVFVMSLIIGGIDYLWQSAEHIRKNMMTRQEVTDEAKQSDGDPHHKQMRRQRAYDIAMNQMLADVPTADVVIVNPTHYAVALKWDRASKQAPVCVAKGVDEIAARIREVASSSKIAIHSDPPTARALFASVDVGAVIKPDHYKAVAAAIRFAEDMRTQARNRVTS
jgi:flagellar biosynthetic protein FlhB